MMMRRGIFISGILMASTMAFSGCGGIEGDDNVMVQNVTLCSRVLNCNNSSAGDLRFVATADGTPILIPGSAAGAGSSDNYPRPGSTHVYDQFARLQTVPGNEACVTFDLTFQLKDNCYASGYCASYASWGYAANAFQVQLLTYTPLDWADGHVMTLPLNPVVESIDFAGNTGAGGVGHLIFDCYNPSPSAGSVQAQLNKALLQKNFNEFKGSLRGVLPEAISNGDLKDLGRGGVPLLEIKNKSASSKIAI